jgi:uncharacterized protein (DUF2342 family)
MIEETIQQIETRLRASPNLAPETRAELQALLDRLRAEAKELPTSTRRFTTEPAETREPESMQDNVNRLRSSVEEFENSHPQLVQTVNHLANSLASLGI